MTWAALRLFAATGSERYLERAQQWTHILDKHYWDRDRGGYFTAADDTGDVVVRLKAASDDAAPNANAIQLSNLIALAALTGEADYDERARQLLQAFAPAVALGPIGHCALLAAELDLDRLVQVAVSTTDETVLRGELQQLSIPGALEFVARPGDPAGRGSLLSDKTAINGKSTAYVCVGPVCSAPIQDAKALQETLRRARTELETAT
jgi:uncharacterized protein YyaL (SSP411 family)